MYTKKIRGDFMIGIASDHAGYEVKKELIEYLKAKNYEVKDYGCDNTDSVDYPVYAFKLCEDIKSLDKGILICTTGIGMSIAANKVKGIRCAKVDTVDEAVLTRMHNNSNVIAISALKNINETKKILDAFLETSFSNEERHIRRNSMVDNYEH